MPHQSGHIYLVVNRNGQYRLIIVSRPTISGEMYGILTTLQAALPDVADKLLASPAAKAHFTTLGFS